MPVEQLNEREQQCLEHLRKAAELEVTLAEYCRSFELDVKKLYSAKQALAKKGFLPGKPAATEEENPSDFVPVRASARRASAPVASGTSPRH